jgi:lipid A disaccharide synthetase
LYVTKAVSHQQAGSESLHSNTFPLVNVTMDEEVVTELIQEECNYVVSSHEKN